MPDQDDNPTPTAALIRQARDGDQEAYDRLFARSVDRLRMFVRLRLGPAVAQHVDSLDVLQETYVLAHRDFSRFENRGTGAFARWLCKIAENVMRNLAEFHGAAKRRPPGQVLPVSRVLEEYRKSETGVATHVARAEGREKLITAMETLDAADLDVMVMRFFEDATVDEIAARVGRSPSAVRRAIGRATVQLGAKLGASEDEA